VYDFRGPDREPQFEALSGKIIFRVDALRCLGTGARGD
jgi:hypothetical protein